MLNTDGKQVVLKEVKRVVAKVDAGPYCLGEKIAYLTGYLSGANGRLSPEAEKYLVWILVCFNFLCRGGIINNTPVTGRGRFDIIPYRALDLIPAGAIPDMEE